jgi:hypothetical protein
MTNLLWHKLNLIPVYVPRNSRGGVVMLELTHLRFGSYGSYLYIVLALLLIPKGNVSLFIGKASRYGLSMLQSFMHSKVMMASF